MKALKEMLLNVIELLLGPAKNFRFGLIRAMTLVERRAFPPDSIRWLLDVHDFIGHVIDAQCVRWGNGVHIKHEIMDGIHSFFYNRVQASARVLDVGCGVGAVAFAIAEHTQSSVIGIDFNKEHIEFAQERFKHQNLRFMVGDALHDLPSEAIDIIVLSSVLEHIVDRPGLLRALVDRYHPSSILIRVPGFERHYHAALKRKLGLFAYTDPDHKIEYTPESFVVEMRNGCLEIEHMELRWGDIWAECKPQK